MIKRTVKNWINDNLNKNQHALVMSSMGRSGSTMLYRRLARSALVVENRVIKQFLYKALLANAWTLQETNLRKGYIFKTHNFPCDRLRDHSVKCIYTFADPYNVIPSVMRKIRMEGKSWLKKHGVHLQASVNSTDELLQGDALRLEENFDAWVNEERADVLSIRLDALWKYQEELSDFVGFHVNLPEKRDRTSHFQDLSDTEQKQVENIYGDLREKVLHNDIIFPGESPKNSE